MWQERGGEMADLDDDTLYLHSIGKFRDTKAP